jgi:DNA (cytosine-5)-methyltransferase 1
MENKHTVVDLFAGVGGLSLGFQENNFEISFANDIDKDASKTFIHNHPKTKFILGDIKELSEDKIRTIIGNKEIDVLVGGVPCQSFSMVGYRTTKKKANLDDPRHYLFREFIRVAKILKPKVVIIENVKAILSSHNGKIKNEIIKGLNELGYEVDYEILNAADFGVSQLRERAIFMGNKLGISNNFPTKTHSSDNYVTIREIFKNIPSVNHEPKQLSGKVLERVKLVKQGNNWKSLPKELQTGSKHSGAYGRLDPNKPSRTLTTRFDTPPGGYVTHPTEDRAITVREGARIQGFPDDFIFIGNRISQYRQVGNAVAVGVSRALAKSIKEMLNDHK